MGPKIWYILGGQKTISVEQKRLLKVLSAFPVSPTSKNNRGIKKTEWVKIDKKTYDACIDPTDYRTPKITENLK